MALLRDEPLVAERVMLRLASLVRQLSERVIDLSTLSVSAFLEIGAAMAVILSAVLGTYAAAAQRARRLFRSPPALRWLNRGTGTVMAGAAAAVATR